MSTLQSTADSDPIAPAAPAISWRGEFVALFALAWPLILAQLAQNAIFTTDVIFMGQLGAKYLAAGTLGASFFIAFQLFGMGLVGVVAPLVAQALGARDIKAIRRIVRAGLWASLLISALVVPLGLNSRFFFRLLGQTEELSVMAEQFLHYSTWTIIPALMFIVLRSFLAALEATRVILLITIAGVFANALGNYLLVAGNLGFPRLELRGSGITTTSVNCFMLLLSVLYVVTNRRFRRYHVFARFLQPDWQRLGEIFRIGTPIGLMLFAEVGLFVSAAFAMGWLGTDEVAGHAVALQLTSITFMVPLGLSQATTVRVGYAFGSGSREGVRMAGWLSLALTVAFMSMTCLIFILIPDPLVVLFLDPTREENRAAVGLAASYLLVAGLFQVFDGAQVTAGAALRGLSDTTWPLFIALFGYWLVGMPVGLALGFGLGWRGLGIWTGLASGLAVVAAILVIRFAMRERLGLLDAKPA